MDTSSRLRKIILIMLETNAAVPVADLAIKISVSKRTVQRELEYLPKMLKKYNLEFASKTGVGVWINGEKSDKELLLQDILNENPTNVSDREYRRKMLTLELLKEKGLKKLYWYSRKFQVSEVTISLDLEHLEAWFNKYNLKIIKKPGSGIQVDGSEENYRKAISAFVAENIDTNIFAQSYINDPEQLNMTSQFQKTGIAQMLSEDVLKRVVITFNAMNSRKISQLTQNAYWGLIMHVGIAVNRILKNETIQDHEKLLEEFNHDDDYKFAKNLAYELEEEFEITIPNIEVAYICLHIKASKHEKISVEYDFNGRSLKNLVNEIIYAFDPDKAYLLKQDEEFLQGLLAHLQPTLVRLDYNMKISNPVLPEIKKQYSDIFKKCENVAKVLSEYTGYEIPEEEIGFITVHFGAAVVRLEAKLEHNRTVNVGIVCSSGIGISRLMSTKIKKIFKDKVKINSYGKNDINHNIKSKEDFLISSLSLNWDFIEVLNVNPLLSENDVQSISRLISKYEKTVKISQEKDEVDINFEQIEFLATQIKNIMSDFSLEYLEKDLSFNQSLNKIAPLFSLENRELIVEDIMQREKLSTQIFAEFGFALLHARTKAVSRPMLKIFTTENAEAFAHKDFKGIKVVFTMLIPVDSNLLLNGEILSSVSSSIVEDDILLETILSGDKEQIRKQLAKTFKIFFVNFLKN